MYNRVYKLLLQEGHATKLRAPAFFNKNGTRLQANVINKNSYGKEVDMQLIRPDLIFVGDEFSIKPNMSKDRLAAGNKRMHQKGLSVALPRYTSDTHFTTMGITALTGEPVCCVVIIQKTPELNFIERYGFDVEAEWEGDLSTFDKVKELAESIKIKNNNKNHQEGLQRLSNNELNADLSAQVLK